MVSWRILSMVAALLATSFFLTEVAAHSCGRELATCLSHLKHPNSPNPPTTCCAPLHKAVASRTSCLCDLFDTENKLVYLADSCGIDAGLTTLVTTFCRHDRSLLGSCPFCCRRDKQGLCVATCCKK